MLGKQMLLPGRDEETGMPANETELEMTQRHVAAGERHVAHQREIVARLQTLGTDTGIAEQLLVEFEATLRDHRAHRDRLEAALG
jgi:hypothetical protein